LLATFTISSTDATPSYLPGPISPGRWKLLIGVPNIRPKSVSSFEAQVYFNRSADVHSSFIDLPLRQESRWYRGDFHMHTGHSDGRCASQAGADVPCPVFVTLEAAVRLAREGALDAAVLDISLNGENVFPAAEELQTRGIPFVFATGYGKQILPEKWRGLRCLAKPFNREQLERSIRSILPSQ